MVDGPGSGSAEAQAPSPAEESRTPQGVEISASDPDAVLQALREEERGGKARADALSAEVKSLTTAIEALTTNRKEIVKAVDAYAKADYPKAIATAKSLAEEKLACIETTLGSRLPAAQQLVEEFAAEVDKVETDLDAAISSLDSATDAEQSANELLAAATASFGKLLFLAKDYEAPVADLTKLQTKLKAAIDNAEAFGAAGVLPSTAKLSVRRTSSTDCPPGTNIKSNLLAAGMK